MLTALGAAAALTAGTVGCKELPGSPGAQGATIGGVGGAAAGALIAGQHNRLLGALIGGAVGAGGGYLIGANSDRIMGKDTEGARKASEGAQSNPATPQQARSASTADLNGDGFVTMDEVAAMRQAGLTDQQMLEKLRATGQVFELTSEQQAFLRQHGVSENVIQEMPQLNREVRDRLMSQQGGQVIGSPQPAPSGAAPSSTPPATGR